MDNRREELRFLWKRFLISLPFFGVGLFLMIPVSVKSIPGVFLLSIGGLLIGKPLVGLLTGSAGSILFPASAGRRVNLMFSIPESRIMERKYDEALSLFLEMIPRDPERLDIYLRIMKLAVKQMKQPEIARDAFKTGLNNLKDMEERKILVRTYKELMNP
ncbi:MAG: hypothetical protein KAR40_13685 [Candidatus Sabulitectum sp.]|nr:hypothetical protein [Candidatus Sabulitectum sp.]